MKPELSGDREASNISKSKEDMIKFVPKNFDYDWVYLYAMDLFNKISNIIDYIDNKADNII